MNILVITYNNFPEGDAGAVRERMFGKMLKACGHNVFFIGMSDSEYGEKKSFQEFEYTSLRLKNNNILEKFTNYFNYSSRLRGYLAEYSKSNVIDVLWIVNLPINAVVMLKKFAKMNNIKLIHDSVEWYSPEQFKLGRLDPNYIFKNIYNSFLIDNNFKVIAISNYLKKHFLSKNIESIRIPIVFDKDDIHFYKKNNSNKLTILYAGSPGKKDYLELMLKGFSLLNKQQLKQIDFVIIGVNLKQVQNMFEKNKMDFIKIEKSLTVLGRLPRREVILHLANVDFTVLLRSQNQRYAKAGFPTKVVESFATGTPVILNISSDLGQYINDGENGLIVKDVTEESFSRAIIKALELSDSEKELMKKNARDVFEKNFDYRLYLAELDELLNK